MTNLSANASTACDEKVMPILELSMQEDVLMNSVRHCRKGCGAGRHGVGVRLSRLAIH